MTREDIVNAMSLEDAIQVFKDTNCYGTMDIAKTVILKTLEQEPCDDCISRQAVIDSLHSKFADGFDSDRWWNSISVLYAINKVSSINPQEPKTEPCEDCISRKAVKELFEEGDVIGIYDFLGIGDLPSVHPKAEQDTKAGHWITCDVLQEVKCSECRVCFRRITNYCPNCGAKMFEKDVSI